MENNSNDCWLTQKQVKEKYGFRAAHNLSDASKNTGKHGGVRITRLMGDKQWLYYEPDVIKWCDNYNKKHQNNNDESQTEKCSVAFVFQEDEHHATTRGIYNLSTIIYGKIISLAENELRTVNRKITLLNEKVTFIQRAAIFIAFIALIDCIVFILSLINAWR